MIITLIDIALLTFMGATAIAILRLRSLFAVVMLSGIYSLLAASMFVALDAVDVAFTEAAVGAGISTVLMITVLSLTGERERAPGHSPILPMIVVTLTGAALIYATFDMPAFGDANAPVNLHVAPRYLNDSMAEVGLPNVVTSVLASYRGYDTLGEVTVIFTAAVAVMMLLGGRKGDDAGFKNEPEENSVADGDDPADDPADDPSGKNGKGTA
jgi:multicomponent Na+:H+ antiporter subunit B